MFSRRTLLMGALVVACWPAHAGAVTPVGRNLLLWSNPPVVADTFTRPDSSTTLDNAETGQTWAVGNSGDGATLPTWGVSSGKAYLAAAGTVTDRHAHVETYVSDPTVQADVTLPSATSGGLLFSRESSTRYFFARLSQSGNAVDIVRNLDGVRSSVASGSVTLTADGTYRLRVVRNGSSIKVYVDGVLLITYTDTNFTTATRHGLFAGDVNVRLDNFRVTADPSSAVDV